MILQFNLVPRKFREEFLIFFILLEAQCASRCKLGSSAGRGTVEQELKEAFIYIN
jgi:hypothetical protein